MSKKDKFVPNGDSDFALMAEPFALAIAREPAMFDIAQEDAQELAESVSRFKAALQACRFGGHSTVAKNAKDESRARAEEIVRRLGRAIRGNKRLDAGALIALGMRPRAKAKMRTCPQEPPKLRFLRAHHEANGAAPMHELSFRAREVNASKPDGAVRLELFVDLVPPEEEIPAFPGANAGGKGSGGRPWYLRSYTRSPIKLVPPMPRLPMRVVYWGRWADSQGNVGPFSATAVAWIEGGSNRMLPGGLGISVGGSIGSAKPVRELDEPAAPAGRAAHYSVAVLEVQYEMLNGPTIEAGDAGEEREAGELPAPQPREQRRLEGPDAESEAA